MHGRRRGSDVNNHAAELRRELADPHRVLDGLGLLDRASQRQARGYVIRCPWHRENTPSCSVKAGPDGTLRIHCFACSKSWDVLSLVAQVHGLDTHHDFPAVLVAAAELARRWDIIEAIEGQERAAERRRAAPPAPPPSPAPEPEPKADYPPADEVAELLAAAILVDEDAEVIARLRARGLDALEVAVRDLALALPRPCPTLPSWARFRGQSWVGAGYRIILPVYDHQGVERSVRAWRMTDEGRKRIAPTGCRMSGLVLADSMMREVLRAGGWPSWNPNPPRFVVVEGEPDFLSWAVRTPLYEQPRHAVVGVESGAWCEAIASRIPSGATVVVRTHHDKAGNGYAATIADTLGTRCRLLRGRKPT